ncbi:hypothetical protein K505DRAFT_368700 [Melanomma pulvis-pyrius CBS 109.77]|uniref:BTB domain-containing protein n=1 Tax=Melanomma pulvis-pyrius CBS 109.77 TaxID=1314802 RepID=A0A6A6WP78_9PLEO|nr:hypothetical protein K505DRAFT_368700 [Melanomma pulvis-pyrius CBS 109.77]
MAVPHPMPSATTGLLEDALKYFRGFEDLPVDGNEDINSSTVFVRTDSFLWTLPRKLVAEHTKVFNIKALGEYVVCERDDLTFQLFIEFMFTGSWKDQGLKVNWERQSLQTHPSDEAVYNGYDPAWKSQAAISACFHGASLRAKRFHDYAIAQVFHIFYTQGASLTPSIAIYACERDDFPISDLMYDMIIHRWCQDNDAIDSYDEGWLKFFNANPTCRDRFLLEVGKPLCDLALTDYYLEIE